MAAPEDMWQCQTVNCGYIYNPDKGDRKGGIPKGVKFEDLPDDWCCPICGGTKKCFKPLAGPTSTKADCELPTVSESGELTSAATTAKESDQQELKGMEKYVCDVCGYVYDPEVGDPDNDIAPGTKFEDIPDDWTCPICGATKDSFSPES